MRIGQIEIKIFEDSKTVWVIKHYYNDSVQKRIDLTVDNIYELEFAIKEIKRKLELT